MAYEDEFDQYDSAERDKHGNLVPGLPGGRGMDVIRQHNESILRKQEAAKTIKNGTDETRTAIAKTPMGPELRPDEDRYEPTLIDPDKPGDDQYLKQDW